MLLSETATKTQKTIRGIAGLKNNPIKISQTTDSTTFYITSKTYPDFWVTVNDSNELPSSQFTYFQFPSDSLVICDSSDFKSSIDIEYPLVLIEGYLMQLTPGRLLVKEATQELRHKPVTFSGKVLKALMTKIKLKPKDPIRCLINPEGTLVHFSSLGGSITLSTFSEDVNQLTINLCQNYLNTKLDNLPVKLIREDIPKTEFYFMKVA